MEIVEALVSGSTIPRCATLTARSMSRMTSLNSLGGIFPVGYRGSSPGQAGRGFAESAAEGDLDGQSEVMEGLEDVVLRCPTSSPPEGERLTFVDLLAAVTQGDMVSAQLLTRRDVQFAEDLFERLYALGRETFVLPAIPVLVQQQVVRVRDPQDVHFLQALELTVVIVEGRAASVRVAHDVVADQDQVRQPGREDAMLTERRQFRGGELIAAAHGRLQRLFHSGGLAAQLDTALFQLGQIGRLARSSRSSATATLSSRSLRRFAKNIVWSWAKVWLSWS